MDQQTPIGRSTANISACIANVRSTRRCTSDFVARKLANLRNFAFFDAPHAIFIFMSEPFDTREASDVGMYAQTLMLALTSRGVASCAQASLGLFPDVVRRHLGIAPSDRLLFGVSFGYEDTSAPANASRVGRASIDDTVRFHR
jgi:nitroreductase